MKMKTKKMLICLLALLVLSLSGCGKSKRCEKYTISDGYNTVYNLSTFFGYCYRDEQMKRDGDTIRLTGYIDETCTLHGMGGDIYDHPIEALHLCDEPYLLDGGANSTNQKYLLLQFDDTIQSVPSSFRGKRVFIVSRIFYSPEGGRGSKMIQPAYMAFIPFYLDTVPDNLNAFAL